MLIKYPGDKATRAWIVRQMREDPELSVLVDLAFASWTSDIDRRAWLRASDSPESLHVINETPWGPMTRWVAASAIVRAWSRLWPDGRA